MLTNTNVRLQKYRNGIIVLDQFLIAAGVNLSFLCRIFAKSCQ